MWLSSTCLHLLTLLIPSTVSGTFQQHGSLASHSLLFCSVQYHRVCYFTNWGALRSVKEARLSPEEIPADLCTHIFYAFASISGLALQAQIPNDLNVFQGEQVSRVIEASVVPRRHCRLAALSSNHEVKGEEQRIEDLDFMWRLGKIRRIRFSCCKSIVKVNRRRSLRFTRLAVQRNIQ